MAPRIPFAFATTGDTTSVPNTSSGTELSWQAGWSPAYELAPEDPGYREIDRGQHNFLWNAITANIKEWQEQTFPEIVSTVNYPVGSIVEYSGVAYVKFQNTDGAISNPSTSNDWRVFNGLTQVENRFRGNQNWNIPGRTGHPLPDETPRDYPSGAEIALGVFAAIAITNATLISGVFSAESGALKRAHDYDVSGFFGIKLPDNRIVTATLSSTSVTGVSKTTTEMYINIDRLIELGIPRGAHKFAGCSELPGVWPDVSDEESIFADYNKLLLSRVRRDVTASRQPSPMTYTNNSPVEMRLLITIQGSWPGSRTLNIGAESYSLFVNSTIQTYMQFDEIIKPGETYSFTGTFTQWIEESL